MTQRKHRADPRRKHEDTKTRRHRRDAESPREFTAWRGPGRRTAAKNRWNEPPSSDRERSSLELVPAACAQEAQASPLLLLISRLGGAQLLFKQEKGKAEPARLRRVGRWEGRLRRTLAFGADGLPSGGRRSSDRRLFRRQSSVPLIRFCGVFLALSALSGLSVGQLGWCAAFVPSCLRVCDGLCDSLCLCASVVATASGRSVQNRNSCRGARLHARITPSLNDATVRGCTRRTDT